MLAKILFTSFSLFPNRSDLILELAASTNEEIDARSAHVYITTDGRGRVVAAR